MASVETLGGLQRRLNASFSQQPVLGEIEARIKKLGRSAKVHGFRPGKVPFKILEQQYGAKVYQEVMGDALKRSFAAEVQSNQLRVVGYPDFELKDTDPASDQFQYSATFEVYPEIVLGDIAAEPLERLTYTLNDADIESTINTLRKQRAVFETVDRAAQNDDQVRIDFTGTLDGTVFEGGEGKDYTLLLGQGRMLPDFENGIIGMKVGETNSFNLTFPENYHGKEVAGKEVTFTITLHSVAEPRLPELDAELARSLGVEDGDVTKLKTEIRENLTRETERRLKAQNKNNVMDLLLKVNQFEVPKGLLEVEAQRLMEMTTQDMQERGVKIPKGMTLPQHLFMEQALKRVKLGLILVELVKNHKLTPQPEHVKTLVRDYAQSFEHPEEVVKWHYSDPSRLKDAEAMVLEENVVAWVTSAAKVSDQTIAFNELMGKTNNA